MQRVTDAVTPHDFFLHALFRNRPSCFSSASVLLKLTDALGLHVITWSRRLLWWDSLTFVEKRMSKHRDNPLCK
jgi:hypothetical protein